MKNSKWMRFLLIVVSVAMVLSLFACGDKGGKNDETTTAAPEGTTAAPENTTVAGGETTTVAGGETTTVAGGEDTTVAGGEDTTVAGGEDTTVAGGEDTTVAGGEDTTVAGGEDTTVAPDDVYAGNWHASVDAFYGDVDGDFSAVETVISLACTNNLLGNTIRDNVEVFYPTITANFVFFGAGWIAVDGYDVENFVCNVYAADGSVLKTVELGLNAAEEGVVTHVSNNMGYAAGTVAHRVTGNLETELIDLTEYADQTVKVVYSIDVATTEYTIDLIEIEVVVPEAPAGEDTTVAGGEDTTVAGGEDTTVAGGEDTTVAGGEDTTVEGGEDTTVAPGPELGSEENPIEVMFTMNDEYTEGTATVTVPAGATYYFQSYGIGGMNLTINDGTPTLLSGNPRMPVVFSITNEGEAEAEYALAVSYPVGSMSNPAQLVIGENTAAIEAGNTQGYYFTYTAEAAGTLTLTISSEAGWTYVVNNITSYVYGDIQWSDSDPVVNPAVVTVAAGDVIEIMVNTYDPADMWSNPAGTITLTAAFEAAPTLDYTVDFVNDTITSNGNVTLDNTTAGVLKVTSTGATTDQGRFWLTLPETVGTGKYIVVTYRYAATNVKNADKIYLNTWASTEYTGPTGPESQKCNLLADGQWHTIVVDATKSVSVTEGQALKYIGFDFFTTSNAYEGDYVEIACIGISDSLEEIVEVCGEVEYDLDYSNCGDQGFSTHTWISSLKTKTTAEANADGNFTGWVVVDGTITDVYYKAVYANGETEWTKGTVKIMAPGDDGYDTYNNAAGTLRTILGNSEDVKNVATYSVPGALFENCTAGDVVTIYIAAAIDGLAEGVYVNFVSLTVTVA